MQNGKYLYSANSIKLQGLWLLFDVLGSNHGWSKDYPDWLIDWVRLSALLSSRHLHRE
jgi:hypothetical protein